MSNINETFSTELNIKQVAETFRVSKSTLRFWEEKGLIHPMRNETNEYRKYSRQAITEIEDIISLRSLGFSLEEIEHIKKSGVDETTVILTDLRERLKQRIKDLTGMIDSIQHQEKLIAEYRRMREAEDYRFCVPEFGPIIRWKWADNNIHNYFTDSYMFIVFYPDQDMHYADGVFADSEEYEKDDILWSPEGHVNPFVECLVETDYGNPSCNNIQQHLDELHRRRYRTGIVIAKFLVFDVSPADGKLHDYFRALIEIIPETETESK